MYEEWIIKEESCMVERTVRLLFCAVWWTGAFAQESDEEKTIMRREANQALFRASACFLPQKEGDQPSIGRLVEDKLTRWIFLLLALPPRIPQKTHSPLACYHIPRTFHYIPKAPPRAPRLLNCWTSAQFRGILSPEAHFPFW